MQGAPAAFEAATADTAGTMLTAGDLLAGSQVEHEVDVPAAVVTPRPAADGGEDGAAPAGRVRLRPLNVATLTLISRAARDDASLVPLLMVKEALVDPVLTLEQVRRLHVGLVHFLVAQVNRISGLAADGEVLAAAAEAPLGRTHLLLARHFGWTPDQVSALTPGQVAVYLAGIEKLLQLDERETP